MTPQQLADVTGQKSPAPRHNDKRAELVGWQGDEINLSVHVQQGYGYNVTYGPSVGVHLDSGASSTVVTLQPASARVLAETILATLDEAGYVAAAPASVDDSVACYFDRDADAVGACPIVVTIDGRTVEYGLEVARSLAEQGGGTYALDISDRRRKQILPMLRVAIADCEAARAGKTADSIDARR